MASEHILRIPRSDSGDDFVLVNASSNGLSPLDLKLLATEGASPYICTLKQSRVSKLRTKHSPLQEAQWEMVLLSTLLQRRAQGHPPETEALDKLEVIATITGNQLVLIFRKNISGITQRLGEIALTKDEDVEIDPTAWAGIAVTRATSLEHEVQDLTTKYEEQGKTIQKLTQQLEDLIEAKKQHENSLLEKFRELLNAKKSKIRDQQRLLAGVKVDPQKAIHIQKIRHPSTSHTPVASRPTKRKASAPARAASPSSLSSSVEEPTKQEVLASSVTPEQATPEHSELDATEDEDSDDLDSVPAPPRKGVNGKGKVVESTSQNQRNEKVTEKVFSPPPPRRDLPFKRSEKVAEKPKTVVERPRVEDEDEETSDDEL